MASLRVRLPLALVTIFLIVPIIEIYLLIQMGGLIGVMPTIGLVVLTAVIGAALLRTQGLQTYLRFHRALSEGRLPATELLEGIALLIGGALLLTPGFFTDGVGFVCLIPSSRRIIIAWFMLRVNPLVGVTMHTTRTPRQGGNVYEGKAPRRHKND